MFPSWHGNSFVNKIMQTNETVVVLDAGGGTVDAVTYKCVNSNPLRLGEEVVAPCSKSVCRFQRRS
jgi:hypothetical protein